MEIPVSMCCHLGMVPIFILSFLSQSTSLPTAEVFPASMLKQYEAQDPSAIFSDPTISCHLGALMGEKNLSGLISNMQMQELDKEPDATGAYPFPGGIRGLYTVAEGIVLIHPDGRLWVGYLHDGTVDYFTNDKNSFQSPPASIREWGGRFADVKWQYNSSSSDRFYERVSVECSEQKLAARVKRFESRKQGKLCDTKRTFGTVAVIVAKPSEQVHFKGEKSYLIDGDLVQLASEENREGEFACSLFHANSKSEKAGSLPRKNLIPVDGKLLAERSKVSTSDSKEWAGDWETPYSSLKIEPLEGNRLRINGTANAGANVGEIEGQIFELAGASAAPAKAQPKEALTCDGLKLYRFNNAIYATESAECGGVGVSFAGAYFKGFARQRRRSNGRSS